MPTPVSSQHLVSIVIVTRDRKQDVLNCLDSLKQLTYQPFEVIVVDNQSTDGTVEALKEYRKLPFKLVANTYNANAAEGRNIGASHASGKYLLFVDSDNIVHPEMVAHLVQGMETLPNAGLVGPLMYYFSDQDIIWWAGSDINLWTSQTHYHGKDTKDAGAFQTPIQVGHIPNVFMTRRDVFESVGRIEPAFEIMYEESDFAEKVKKAGYSVWLVPTAVTYHNTPRKTDKDSSLRFMGLHNPQRTFWISRNRILFMRRNASALQLLLFYVFFLPLFTAYYCFFILRFGEFKIARAYLRGVLAGVRHR